MKNKRVDTVINGCDITRKMQKCQEKTRCNTQKKMSLKAV